MIVLTRASTKRSRGRLGQPANYETYSPRNRAQVQHHPELQEEDANQQRAYQGIPRSATDILYCRYLLDKRVSAVTQRLHPGMFRITFFLLQSANSCSGPSP